MANNSIQLSTQQRMIQMLSDLAASIEKQIKFVMLEKNVPKNSRLVNSVNSSYNPDQFELAWFANYYYEYLSQGRKKFTKRVPYKALLEWIRRYNIRPRDSKMSQNQLAWVIQRSIYLNGIRGRNFIQAVNDTAQRTFETAIDADLLDTITAELTQYFNEK
ncbi:hypothetical protein OKW21_006053 [Catalinimonas alkaloidigena]|uniref:hypothetical protein n=1 Tax=Catalinimonas alkaloidigena TaxID=1075417 RepID=UPI002404ED71|nr:hypothetical protein [Catalinimonas alkaloidigena]MDF9800790.1 hypothetical protein [Catalinimonas alkaloidigena]